MKSSTYIISTEDYDKQGRRDNGLAYTVTVMMIMYVQY
jgi:hypothetical protein